MRASDLRPFQRRFLKAALAPGVEVAALSLPRGNGKTTLLAHLATRSLTPGDPLFVAGAQNVLIAGSIKQSRPGFRLARAALGEDGFRYEDSNQGTKIRVGDGVSPPRKIHDVLPVYPSAARALRVQGLVILEATIGPTGEPAQPAETLPDHLQIIDLYRKNAFSTRASRAAARRSHGCRGRARWNAATVPSRRGVAGNSGRSGSCRWHQAMLGCSMIRRACSSSRSYCLRRNLRPTI